MVKRLNFLGSLQVLVILWMRMAADKAANIYCLFRIIAECQTDCQVACILCFDNVNAVHIVSSLQFLLNTRTAYTLLWHNTIFLLVQRYE